MPEDIKEFFAVTVSPGSVSVYWVRHGVCSKESQESSAVAEKIDMRGTSKLAIGTKLTSAMIAVCSNLIPYIPEGGGTSTFQRKIEMVNTHWWSNGSAPIAALFLNRSEAMKCFSNQDHIACDPRWLNETKATLEAIGTDNPIFEVCHYPNLRLLPE